ncbi:MAG TPA: NfeD family protein [Actinomycetota bacterium]|nr:NfeD family protein [Actinomycetota bacterium]
MRRALPLLPLLVAALVLSHGPSVAQQRQGLTVAVVKVKGLIDPALASYVRGTVEDAEREGALVVLQLDSRGAYGAEALRLGEAVRQARVPVVVWVGPRGARAEGGALFVAYSSSLVAMAPGAGIGPARPFELSRRAEAEPPAEVAELSRRLAALAPGAGARPQAVEELLGGAVMPAGRALTSGAVALVAADIPELLRGLDGRTVRTGAGPVTLDTAGRPDQPVTVRFHDIGLWPRILHAVSTPTAVYVLLVLSLWSLALEATQPGFGMAGIGGVLGLAFAGYGLWVVPVRWWGLALLLGGMGLQALDVLVRRLGALTAAGTLLFAAGSVLAWWGVAPAVDLSPWLVGLATLAGVVFFGFGMTVALRARERVRRAQVGLVGLVGEARADLDPEGAVYVKGTLWRARSMDGPIPKGTRVRVRGIDGLVLRVEREPD